MNATGILGGTFDPVHNGHSRIALDIAEKCHFDEVLLIPNAQSPLRDRASASDDDRLAMLQQVAMSDGRFSVDARELSRPAPSYTVDTLEALHSERPGQALCFILGMDAFCQFHRWHRWRDILQVAHLVVAHRPGSVLSIGDEDLQSVYAESVITSPGELHSLQSGCIYLCDVTRVDVSATQVRENRMTGKSITGLVAQPVEEYIKEHRLYQ